MSFTVRTNIGNVTANLTNKLAVLRNKEYLLRPVCNDLVDLMTKRIHIDGKDSAGREIGTYSDSYMVVRTGNFRNAKKFKKGKDKGKLKDAGIYTKGKEAGGKREKYGRSNDTKVVISLTRQLENDWAVVARPKGYGIGFHDKLNFVKASGVEHNYHKKIFHMTPDEKEFAIKRINKLVKQAMENES